MATIKKWQIYCNSEEKWSVGYGKDAPTKCYYNVNHTVNPESQQELEIEGQTTTLIRDETVPTGGNRQTRGYVHDFPVGASNYDISFTTPVNVFRIRAQLSGISDILDCVIDPNYSLGEGSLTADVLTGDSVIQVNPDKLDKLALGLELVVSDGVQGNFLSRVTAIDSVTSTVTCDAAALSDFSKDTSVVKTNLYCIRDYKVFYAGSHDFQLKSGGVYVSAGTIIRFAYNNVGNAPVRVGISLDYAF